MSIIKEKKYAVVIAGKPITDYMYDDVVKMSNTIFGLQIENNNAHTIHAYDRITGKLLFKKEEIINHETVDGCIIIRLKDGRIYIYFDLETTIRGPFLSSEINENKGIVVVSKVRKGVDILVNRVYGAYHTDRLENPLMLSIKYDEINLELDDIIPISYKGHVGIADYYGNIMFAPKYDGIDSYFNNQIFDLYSSKRGTSTLIDTDGDVICELDTKYSIDADEKLELLFVENEGKYGVYDNEGFEIFPIILTDCCIDRDVVEVKIGRKRIAYIPKIDKVVGIDGYKYTRSGKLKYFDGRRWRTVEKE